MDHINFKIVDLGLLKTGIMHRLKNGLGME
jgi:hypothetical protein